MAASHRAPACNLCKDSKCIAAMQITIWRKGLPADLRSRLSDVVGNTRKKTIATRAPSPHQKRKTAGYGQIEHDCCAGKTGNVSGATFTCNTVRRSASIIQTPHHANADAWLESAAAKSLLTKAIT